MNNCLVCNRINSILKNENPFFVTELKTGYVVLCDYQSYWGYTLFLSKQHAVELHQLDATYKSLFLLEMAQVAEAVYKSFNPDKLNYELLGNLDAHLHWHIIPRRKIDLLSRKSIWEIPQEDRSYRPTPHEIQQLKEKLLLNLELIK
jgi:diadenosine tetraphosphate (Ap4A) HIT family hydrolase